MSNLNETAEQKRLNEARDQKVPWKKWGPYLSERQWGTVREDYSDNGDAWSYFSHDQARSRAYHSPASVIRSCSSLRGPGIRRHSSGVRRGRLRLHLDLFELSIGLDQSCLTLRELRFRPLKSRFGLCQCHLAVSRI